MRKTSTDTHCKFLRSCFFSENEALEEKKSDKSVNKRERLASTKWRDRRRPTAPLCPTEKIEKAIFINLLWLIYLVFTSFTGNHLTIIWKNCPASQLSNRWLPSMGICTKIWKPSSTLNTLVYVQLCLLLSPSFLFFFSVWSSFLCSRTRQWTR